MPPPRERINGDRPLDARLLGQSLGEPASPGPFARVSACIAPVKADYPHCRLGQCIYPPPDSYSENNTTDKQTLTASSDAAMVKCQKGCDRLAKTSGRTFATPRVCALVSRGEQSGFFNSLMPGFCTLRTRLSEGLALHSWHKRASAKLHPF